MSPWKGSLPPLPAAVAAGRRAAAGASRSRCCLAALLLPSRAAGAGLNEARRVAGVAILRELS